MSWHLSAVLQREKEVACDFFPPATVKDDSATSMLLNPKDKTVLQHVALMRGSAPACNSPAPGPLSILSSE